MDGPAPLDLKLTIPDDPARSEDVTSGIRAETDRDGTRLQWQRLSSIC